MKHLFQQRPLSWSAISSFEFSKEQWFDKYVLGKVQQSNSSMNYGKILGEKLATDPLFLPQVLRYPVFEQKLEARIKDINLIGFLDSFHPKTKAFYEYKSSSNKKRWTQKTANTHGQLLMYKFLIWRNYGVPPEDVGCSLFYIPVEEKGSFEMQLAKEPIKRFDVKHTTVELLKFAKYVQDVYEEMILYANLKKVN